MAVEADSVSAGRQANNKDSGEVVGRKGGSIISIDTKGKFKQKQSHLAEKRKF
jgi:hypothetical protein